MQRQGGGKQKGGGNNPSCGCDMQAGWPSASVFPRGGLQGGGMMNFNEFNLALTKNGKTRHLRGKWNANGNNKKKNNTKKNNKKNNNKNNTNNKNNNMNNTNDNINVINTNSKMSDTSAPEGMEKVMWKGNIYVTNTSSGDTYTMKSNGEKGNYVGKYVKSADGSRTLEVDSSMPESNSTSKTPNYGPRTPNYGPRTPNYPPGTPNYEPISENALLPPAPETNSNETSEELEEEEPKVKGGIPLSQDGGKRTRKHGKGCPCFMCVFKKLKLAGGGR